MNKLIIQTTWDGEPVWREQTAGEKLLEALNENGLKEIQPLSMEEMQERYEHEMESTRNYMP